MDPVFAWVLLQGFDGEADLDAKGFITASELGGLREPGGGLILAAKARGRQSCRQEFIYDVKSETNRIALPAKSLAPVTRGATMKLSAYELDRLTLR